MEVIDLELTFQQRMALDWHKLLIYGIDISLDEGLFGISIDLKLSQCLLCNTLWLTINCLHMTTFCNFMMRLYVCFIRKINVDVSTYCAYSCNKIVWTSISTLPLCIRGHITHGTSKKTNSSSYANLVALKGPGNGSWKRWTPTSLKTWEDLKERMPQASKHGKWVIQLILSNSSILANPH